MRLDYKVQCWKIFSHTPTKLTIVAGWSGYTIISEHLENLYYLVPKHQQEIL